MSETSPKSLNENLIAFGIILVAFFALYYLKPVYPFQPHGVVLPMVKKLPAASESAVIVYPTAPYSYKVLAYVNVEGHSLNPDKQQQQQMLEYAKTLAKKVGADGLIIKVFGYEGASSNNPAPLAKYVLFGEAIKTN